MNYESSGKKNQHCECQEIDAPSDKALGRALSRATMSKKQRKAIERADRIAAARELARQKVVHEQRAPATKARTTNTSQGGIAPDQPSAARLCQRPSTKAFPEQKTPPTKPPATKVAALNRMKYTVLQQNGTTTMSLKAMFAATSASPAASQKRKKAGNTFPWMFVSGTRPGGAGIVRQTVITGRPWNSPGSASASSRRSEMIRHRSCAGGRPWGS